MFARHRIGLLSVLVLLAPTAATAISDIPFRDLTVTPVEWRADGRVNGVEFEDSGTISSTGAFTIAVPVNGDSFTFSGTYVAEIDVADDLRAGIGNLAVNLTSLTGTVNYISVDVGNPLNFAGALNVTRAFLDVPTTIGSDTTTLLFDLDTASAILGVYFFTCLEGRTPSRCKWPVFGFPELYMGGTTIEAFPSIVASFSAWNVDGDAGVYEYDGVVTYSAISMITNPEPSTAVLLGFGLVGLLAVRRRGAR
jgi:hypothetical protein